MWLEHRPGLFSQRCFAPGADRGEAAQLLHPRSWGLREGGRSWLRQRLLCLMQGPGPDALQPRGVFYIALVKPQCPGLASAVQRSWWLPLREQVGGEAGAVASGSMFELPPRRPALSSLDGLEREASSSNFHLDFVQVCGNRRREQHSQIPLVGGGEGSCELVAGCYVSASAPSYSPGRGRRLSFAFTVIPQHRPSLDAPSSPVFAPDT